jgi:hypothetical protein
MLILQPGQRKFILAMTLGVGCLLLCAFGRMSGSETVTVVSILSALYKAANVVDKRLGGAG